MPLSWLPRMEQLPPKHEQPSNGIWKGCSPTPAGLSESSAVSYLWKYGATGMEVWRIAGDLKQKVHFLGFQYAMQISVLTTRAEKLCFLFKHSFSQKLFAYINIKFYTLQNVATNIIIPAGLSAVSTEQ